MSEILTPDFFYLTNVYTFATLAQAEVQLSFTPSYNVSRVLARSWLVAGDNESTVKVTSNWSRCISKNNTVGIREDVSEPLPSCTIHKHHPGELEKSKA